VDVPENEVNAEQTVFEQKAAARHIEVSTTAVSKE